MPFCEECGNEITDVAKFCPNCGTKTKGDAEVTKIVKKKIKKRSKQIFQSLPPQKKLEEKMSVTYQKEQTSIDVNEKDTCQPEGTDPWWLGRSILMFIVSLGLWIPFVLMDEDYLTRITTPEGGMTTLDGLSFLLLFGILSSGWVACFAFITSRNPKLVEEWKEWNLKEEMRKNNPDLLSEGDKLTAPKEVGLTDSSKGGGWTLVLAVGIGLVVIGMLFIDLSLDSSLWFYVLGLGIGALGMLVLLIWALGIWVWIIDAT